MTTGRTSFSEGTAALIQELDLWNNSEYRDQSQGAQTFVADIITGVVFEDGLKKEAT